MNIGLSFGPRIPTLNDDWTAIASPGNLTCDCYGVHAGLLEQSSLNIWYHAGMRAIPETK